MYQTIAQIVLAVLLVSYCFYLRSVKNDLIHQVETAEQANQELMVSIENMQKTYEKEKEVLLERHKIELENNVKYEKVIKYVYENPETNTSKRFSSVLDFLQFDSNSSN